MYLFCADDNPIQLKRASELLELMCKEKNIDNYEIVEFQNGAELLEKAAVITPSVILLDINMPVLDGLSTLVKLRSSNSKAKIIMVSSEDSNVVKRFAKGGRTEIDDSKKTELFNKVVERVRKNKEEEGKINSVLDACGNLGLDPVQVAKDLGADEYILKPYEAEEACKVLLKHVTASTLLS